ncbi:hypothetical protein CISIN_1g031166mg [Citrus sinensis]|uniref:Uncharacterized protein n=1 Tax=Citrus sinensis TaxID=2711 RepID=A0A067GYN7_CITSI|nr:hypothetical protein CISIN_1g031166mg [Citrus sinensis]
MSLAPSVTRLHSPFLCCPLNKLSSSATTVSLSQRNQRSSAPYPCIRAELDQNTVVAISVGLVSVAVGIGIPIFYETQIDNAYDFPIFGAGQARKYSAMLPLQWLRCSCRFCMGTGSVTVELGGDEREFSKCINCDGVGSLTCTTCQGTGIQPRYLDRREFKDDD